MTRTYTEADMKAARAEALERAVIRLKNHAVIRDPHVKLTVEVCVEQIRACITAEESDALNKSRSIETVLPIMLEGAPGAALNAVIEDYPEIWGAIAEHDRKLLEALEVVAVKWIARGNAELGRELLAAIEKIKEGRT